MKNNIYLKSETLMWLILFNIQCKIKNWKILFLYAMKTIKRFKKDRAKLKRKRNN